MSKDAIYPLYPLLRSKIGRYSLENRDFAWELSQKEPDSDDPEAWLFKTNRGSYEFLEKMDGILHNILNIQGLNPEKIKVLWVGQSHLDIAWEWRMHQTIEKAIVTYRKAIYHMKNHPTYTFAASQPLTLEYVRQKDPELFELIKKYVAEGRFELVGGMWVEPDARMGSGESFVRQRLYGQYFYMKHFGRISEVEWLPDTFGYAYSLPQIFLKSGSKYFFTTKVWGGVEKFNAPWPFVNFIWEGPDGSRVLAHVAPQMFGPIYSWKAIEQRSKLLKEDEEISFSYKENIDPIKNDVFCSEPVPLLPVFFGLGDGGHGPTGEEVAIVDRLMDKSIGEYATVKKFFEQLEEYRTRLPIWKDELYFQIHWGTLTTQSFIKKALRYLEWRLSALENVCTLIEFGNGFQAPVNTIETIWKDICTNQFHDIYPGTSIPEVYDDVYDMIFQDLRWLQRIEKICIEQLAFGKEYTDFIGRISDAEIPVIIVNLMPFPVREIVSVNISGNSLNFEDLQSPGLSKKEFELSSMATVSAHEKIVKNETKTKIYVKSVSIADDMAKSLNSVKFQDGTTQPVQFIEKDDPMLDLLLHRPSRLEFVADLEPYEVKFVSLTYDYPEGLSETPSIVENKDSFILANELNELKISKHNGAIESWIWKKDGQKYPILTDDSLKLNVYGDMGDVWEFADDYKENIIDMDLSKTKVTCLEKGPLRWVINVETFFEDLDSSFSTNFILYHQIDALYVETTIDPKDPAITVKMQANLGFESNFSEAEIPFATIKRPTQPKSLYEKCRDELNCQTFVCFESASQNPGVTFINEGKYGFSTEQNKIELTIFRKQRYPKVASEAWCLDARRKRIDNKEEIPATSDPFPHLVRLKIVPYKGSRITNKIHQIAHSFNVKTLAEIIVPENRKKIPKFYFSNVISKLNPELEIVSIKKPHPLAGIEEKTMIVRINNISSDAVDAIIQLDPRFECKNVIKVDLLERKISDDSIRRFAYTHENAEITDHFKPFEVNTYALFL